MLPAVPEDVVPKDWRERKAQRQQHWSRLHGFKFGRKIGDWSKQDEEDAAAEAAAAASAHGGDFNEEDDAEFQAALLQSLGQGSGEIGRSAELAGEGADDGVPVEVSAVERRQQVQLQPVSEKHANPSTFHGGNPSVTAIAAQSVIEPVAEPVRAASKDAGIGTAPAAAPLAAAASAPHAAAANKASLSEREQASAHMQANIAHLRNTADFDDEAPAAERDAALRTQAAAQRPAVPAGSGAAIAQALNGRSADILSREQGAAKAATSAPAAPERRSAQQPAEPARVQHANATALQLRNSDGAAVQAVMPGHERQASALHQSQVPGAAHKQVPARGAARADVAVDVPTQHHVQAGASAAPVAAAPTAALAIATPTELADAVAPTAKRRTAAATACLEQPADASASKEALDAAVGPPTHPAFAHQVVAARAEPAAVPGPTVQRSAPTEDAERLKEDIAAAEAALEDDESDAELDLESLVDAGPDILAQLPASVQADVAALRAARSAAPLAPQQPAAPTPPVADQWTNGAVLRGEAVNGAAAGVAHDNVHSIAASAPEQPKLSRASGATIKETGQDFAAKLRSAATGITASAHLHPRPPQ